MKKGKDKMELVQLCHQHCVTFSPRDIVGMGRHCAGRAPRLWDRRTRVTTVRAYWDLEVEASTDPGRHGSQASGWFLRGFNE